MGAKILLCDSSAASCVQQCQSGSVSGETVTWNFCCSLGTVTTGQYARIETWDSDFTSSDELGGHVLVLLDLEPGSMPTGTQTLPLTGLGEHTDAGSTVDVS